MCSQSFHATLTHPRGSAQATHIPSRQSPDRELRQSAGAARNTAPSPAKLGQHGPNTRCPRRHPLIREPPTDPSPGIYTTTAHALPTPTLPKAYSHSLLPPTNGTHPSLHCKGSHFRDKPLRYSPQLHSGMHTAAPAPPQPHLPPRSQPRPTAVSPSPCPHPRLRRRVATAAHPPLRRPRLARRLRRPNRV